MGILLWDSGLLLWIKHCWCCVFLICNARALKASVVASNAALKPNAEHLEHDNVLESIFFNILMSLTVFGRLRDLSTIYVSGNLKEFLATPR